MAGRTKPQLKTEKTIKDPTYAPNLCDALVNGMQVAENEGLGEELYVHQWSSGANNFATMVVEWQGEVFNVQVARVTR